MGRARDEKDAARDRTKGERGWFGYGLNVRLSKLQLLLVQPHSPTAASVSACISQGSTIFCSLHGHAHIRSHPSAAARRNNRFAHFISKSIAFFFTASTLPKFLKLASYATDKSTDSCINDKSTSHLLKFAIAF